MQYSFHGLLTFLEKLLIAKKNPVETAGCKELFPISTFKLDVYKNGLRDVGWFGKKCTIKFICQTAVRQKFELAKWSL